MFNYKELLLTLGINDVSAFLQFINATGHTGPSFKAAAANAIEALTVLGVAAQTPSV